MPKKRPAGMAPEPPWSFAPSEVADWMASTAGSRRARASRPRRPLRVKEFAGSCPTAAEGKLLRRLEGLGFEKAERTGRLSALFRRIADSRVTEGYRGMLGGTRVQIHLRKSAALELRIAFVPRVSYRRAPKFLSRLGVRGLEGKWT